jgi:hypothetical protein
MSIIQRFKSILGYTWASLCFVVILATFFGLNVWERTLANGTGIHVSPVFSGGEVRQSIDHGTYRTQIHRPVFDGLIGERADGFIQIDWVPNDGRQMPVDIAEDIDIDGDSKAEMHIVVETVPGSVHLTRNAPWVLDPEPLVKVDSEQILRVRLRNPRK